MDENLKKSLTDLIDETLMELEELKKSRYSASEVKMDKEEKGMGSHPAQGSMSKEEDKDEEKEEKAEKAEDCEEEDKDEDMDKGENEKATARPGRNKTDAPSLKEEDLMDKGENEKATARPGRNKTDDSVPPEDKKLHKEEEKDEEEKKDKKEEVRKSQEESLTLMKSFVDERVKPLEDKINSLFELVNKIADQPVQPKGYTSRVTPLTKSADEGNEPLTKSQVVDKLLELKKSGSKVDSLDVTKAEIGQDLAGIVTKYKLS